MELLNLHPEIQMEFTRDGATHRRRVIAWADSGEPMVVGDDGFLRLARMVPATHSRVIGAVIEGGDR